jgi:hypothetical protein
VEVLVEEPMEALKVEAVAEALRVVVALMGVAVMAAAGTDGAKAGADMMVVAMTVAANMAAVTVVLTEVEVWEAWMVEVWLAAVRVVAKRVESAVEEVKEVVRVVAAKAVARALED